MNTKQQQALTEAIAKAVVGAVSAILADVEPTTEAKVAKAPKASKTKPAKTTKAKTAKVTERVVLDGGGNARHHTVVGGRIKANRAATKAEAKAAGLKGSTAKPAKLTLVEGGKGKRFLTSKNRAAYVAAALKQDEEYLEAIQEHFGFEGRNPSTKEAAFYALDVELKVPGFKVGEGYRKLFADQA